MATVGIDADEVASDIKDALRYTAVLPDDGYWARGTSIREKLVEAGCQSIKQSSGWAKTGYKGRNEAFIGPNGMQFEVQFHTRSSLDAAEATHGLYETARVSTDMAEVAALNAQQEAIFAAVPIPDDVP